MRRKIGKGKKKHINYLVTYVVHFTDVSIEIKIKYTLQNNLLKLLNINPLETDDFGEF